MDQLLYPSKADLKAFVDFVEQLMKFEERQHVLEIGNAGSKPEHEVERVMAWLRFQAE
jgi:hypothetical protein